MNRIQFELHHIIHKAKNKLFKNEGSTLFLRLQYHTLKQELMGIVPEFKNAVKEMEAYELFLLNTVDYLRAEECESNYNEEEVVCKSEETLSNRVSPINNETVQAIISNIRIIPETQLLLLNLEVSRELAHKVTGYDGSDSSLNARIKESNMKIMEDAFNKIATNTQEETENYYQEGNNRS